jgi:hypothetical protein
MSEFDQKQAAAMAELQATKMWPSNYDPPIYHLYRLLGLRMRPPHYAPFIKTMISQGVYFGIFWGFFMWIAQWRGSDMSLLVMVTIAAITGALFGFFMALSFAYGRRKWKLTDWDNL